MYINALTRLYLSIKYLGMGTPIDSLHFVLQSVNVFLLYCVCVFIKAHLEPNFKLICDMRR